MRSRIVFRAGLALTLFAAAAAYAAGPKAYIGLFKDNAVAVVDTADNRLLTTIPIPPGPHGMVITPDGSRALVVSQGPGILTVIDVARDEVMGTVKVGTLPHWIALGPGGRLAYVTNEGSNDLTVVNLDALTVVATLPVGNAPRKIVVQPAAAAAMSGTATSGGEAAMATRIAGFIFDDLIQVKAGQRVTWTNNDPVPHTVTSDDGLWDSGDIASGKSFSRTFEVPGTYDYHCNNHPAMQGTVVVSAM
jgi:YVTN family beta-propeller protein